MIDASIPLGVRPVQVESPLNAMAKVLQVQQAQQEGQLGTMKMDEYKRGLDEKNKLAQIYSGALNPDGTLDRNKLFSAAAAGGLGAQIPGLQKTFTEADKAQGEVDKQKFEIATKRYGVLQQTMGALKDRPDLNKDMVVQAGQALVQQGILPLDMYQKAVQAMPDDPAQLRARLTQGLASQLPPEKIFEVFAPKAEKIDNGQQISFRDTNSNSPTFGQVTAGAPVQKLQSPDNAASVNASLANASATRAAAATNAQATRDAAQITSNQNTEMKLGDDYRAQSKNFKETADAYKQISAVLDKATTSAAATLAGATKFMKMIDPGSVVRESELGMALAATGVFDRAANYFNTLQRGKVLTANQVADFKNITKQINDAAATQQQLIDRHFTEVAKGYKLRPEMVVQDFGQNAVGGKSSVLDQADAILRGGK